MPNDGATKAAGTPVKAIELKGVSKRFGSDVWAMRDVSFTAGQGEFVSLLGPSGCGKTTTLRTIAGFEMPTQGEIRLGDVEVANLPPWKRDIGVVFQTYALFPFLTTAENVAFGLKMRRRPRQEIAERVKGALSIVGLTGLEDRYPRQMSGGQRQRVALARALVIQPRLLLLDEPLSNLDAKLRDEMRLELKRIQRESGITTVFVTHDQEEAFSLSDRVIVMNGGSIRQMGTPQEIWRSPNSRFVADFIGVENLLSGTAEAKQGQTVVRLESGHMLTPATPGPRTGPVTVAIRAGDIRFSADDAPESVAGEIVDADYRGDMFVYRVATAVASQPLVVQAPSHEKLSGRVSLVMPPEKMVVLDDL